MNAPAHHTLDLIDRAFIGRFSLAPGVAPGAAPPKSVDAAAPGPAAGAAAATTRSVPPVAPAAVVASCADPHLSRLLAAVPDQWLLIADEIEAAQAAGCRVIAVTSGQPDAGCTLVARGAFLTLQSRGQAVACVSKPPLQCGDLKAREHHADRADIVLVDAGIWFPPGPIRQRHVAQLSFGCDAVILVRRADRAAVPAYGTTLAAIGLRVLGEVITCEPLPCPDDPGELPRA